MNEELIKQTAIKTKISTNQIKVVLELLEEGATVPFIARYRKEKTNGLDENQIREIEKEFNYIKDLNKRKEDVIRLIDTKGLLTDDLKLSIMNATKLVEVEDLYRPFKEKKKTKATNAISYGLEPLADIIMSMPTDKSREEYAKPFLNENVHTIEDAILNASYIIAERISDDASFRKVLRENLINDGVVVSKMKKNASDEMGIFKNYYDYKEPLKQIKSHRILALNRGENLDVLTISIEPNKDKDISYLSNSIIKNKNTIFYTDIVNAIQDSYKRLIYPSISREVYSEYLDNAFLNAIKIFGMNLKSLLLQAPLKGKVVLGVDPAFRTGCKLAVVDETGKFLEKGIIYPNETYKGATVSVKTLEESKDTIERLVKKYKVNLISIGNGTASRETEEFIANTIKERSLDVKYVIVSEAGASVYSASKLAQEEFPDFHVEERSAISIARRLQDPLSELVKIDPKSIGVGQYQHDVNEKELSKSLDDVVIEAVNKVGVDVNTASLSLLKYVSGVNKQIANNIISYRDTNGKFKNRKEILKVSGLGPKTYEQCIGFMRVLDGTNPLDVTGIHPESYSYAKDIIKLLDIKELGSADTKEKVENASKSDILSSVKCDKYTLDDILNALKEPLRDVREEYSAPQLRSDLKRLEDLKIGDKLEGTVRNVVDFGAFVDCGVKYDGLVHISKITKGYVKHPSQVLQVGDLVTVYVIGVDVDKCKLSLSMINE